MANPSAFFRWLALSLLLTAIASPARSQTLGAVEHRLDKLEKAVRRLDGHEEKRTPGPALKPAAGEALSALERAVSGLVAGQEEERHSTAALLDQVALLKGDLEARLDAAETRLAGLQSAPPSAPPQIAAEAMPPVLEKPISADDRYREAMAFAKAKDWPKAEFAFDSFIASFPEDARLPQARFELGRSLDEQGKPAKAAQTFLKLYEDNPDADLAQDVLFALADALTRIGPDTRAQACNVYDEIDAVFGKQLSVVRRSALLDGRIKLNCE
jgi:TolA-binding protein